MSSIVYFNLSMSILFCLLYLLIIFQVDLHYGSLPRDDYGSCGLELTCANLKSAEIVKTVTSYT